jgi:hypothetical protein
MKGYPKSSARAGDFAFYRKEKREAVTDDSEAAAFL